MAKKRRKIDWNNVVNKIKESEKSSFQEDGEFGDKLYVPKLNEDGTFQSIIRFLPRPEKDGDGIPFVKIYNHGYQDVGGWFIENCPTTIGKPCYVCKENSKEWNSGNQDLARKRKRKLNYYSNILIVKDPQNKENEGKVFVYRYGKKIYDKIMEKLSPDEDSVDEPVSVFDYEEGMNFKLKIKKVGGYNNFDASEFTGTTTSIGDDKFIDEVENQLSTLGNIVDESKFKTEEELKEKFENKSSGVLSSKKKTSRTSNDNSEDENGDDDLDNVDENVDFFDEVSDDLE